MSITIDGKTFRNLEEQVQYNSERIAEHYAIDRALANFGIQVVGQVSSTAFIPGVTTFPLAPNYDGQYGDAYAVGLQGNPMTYFIFTRPDPNAGYTSPYWLNVGKLGIEGPQGPQGEQGEKGNPGTSTRWYFGNTVPTSAANEGDIFLMTSGAALGDIYGYTGQTWRLLGNIQGPAGIQGPRGATGATGAQGPVGPQGIPGAPGQNFHIEGTIDSSALLPTPSQAIRAGAYLVGTEAPYHLWVIEGGHDEGDLLMWVDCGNIAAVEGPVGERGPQGYQGDTGFGWYVSNRSSIVNNKVPISSIQNLAGRTPQPGDLVIVGDSIYQATEVDSTDIKLVNTGKGIRGPAGPQGPTGQGGVNFTYQDLRFDSFYIGKTGFLLPMNGVTKIEIVKVNCSYRDDDPSGNAPSIPYAYDMAEQGSWILYSNGSWAEYVEIPPQSISTSPAVLRISTYANNTITIESDFGTSYYGGGLSLISLVLKYTY